MIAHGAFTANGVANKTLDKIVFPDGTFKLRHSPGQGRHGLMPRPAWAARTSTVRTRFLAVQVLTRESAVTAGITWILFSWQRVTSTAPAAIPRSQSASSLSSGRQDRCISSQDFISTETAPCGAAGCP